MAGEHQVQEVINNFKQWLPVASHTLKGILEQNAQKEERVRTEELRRQKEAEEQ